MPIRQGRKVTELTALNSASLNTYVVGVDNNVTYKISLDVLEDAVVKIVSSSTDARLDAIELYTSSFTASIDISSLNEYTQSTNNRLDNIEAETSSFLKSEGSIEFYIPTFSSGTILLTSSIALDRGNVIIGSSASVHQSVPEKLAVYAGNTDSYNLISGHGSINNYLQLNIKNFGTFGNSSSDVVATADNGTEESFYIDMGINGSNYNEDTIVGSANDAYIYGTGYNFHVGNASEYPVMIFAGGFDASGEHLKLIIDPFDNHTMTGSLEISGNFTCLGNITGDIQFSNLLNVPNIISSSQQITDFGFISSSQSINTELFATTGSNQFSGSQYISGSVIFNNGTQIYQNDDDIHISSSGEIRVTSNNSNYKFGNDGNFYTSVGGVVFTHDGLINQIPGASGDNINIVVGINDSIVLTTDAGDGDYAWEFDNNGNLTVPGNVYGAPNLATKGSNIFDGNQIMTGSLVVSGSTDLTQLTISGDLNVLGKITGSIAATNGVISGSSQLASTFPTKTSGTWNVPVGASTQSFTVDANNSYTMWVNGNIPNGIINWNATVTISNTNVPAVGTQYGWYYSAGNQLVLTSIPSHIVGTPGSIITTSPSTTTANTFSFGITNNSGTTQTINYGYIKL